MLDMCEFWILGFIAHFIMMRQVFLNVFLFYSEIVNEMRQVSITISEFTGAVQAAEWTMIP